MDIWRINTSCTEGRKADWMLYAAHPCSKACSSKSKEKEELDAGSNRTGGLNCVIKACSPSFQKFPWQVC